MSEDLPPSALFILYVVEREGPLSRQDLLDETGLCERTLDRGLDKLEDAGYVTLDWDNEDLRRIVATMASTQTLNQSRD